MPKFCISVNEPCSSSPQPAGSEQRARSPQTVIPRLQLSAHGWTQSLRSRARPKSLSEVVSAVQVQAAGDVFAMTGFDSSWSCSDLAHNLCEVLVKKGQLKDVWSTEHL
ncbi:Lrriq1, partial [Symbiodinium sp. KB8]